MKSIRHPFGIFNWSGHKQGALKRSDQGLGGGNVAFQVGDNASNRINLSIRSRDIAGNSQGNADYPIQVGQSRRSIEINDRQWNWAEGNRLTSYIHGPEFGCGVLAHDGSYNLFKWDNAKGCMVPFESSTLRKRLSRSIEAFMRAWRMS